MGREQHRVQPHGAPPTPKEFRDARHRELARLNMRLSTMTTATHHTPEDLRLLEGDTVEKRDRDRDVIRRWTANSRGDRGAS